MLLKSFDTNFPLPRSTAILTAPFTASYVTSKLFCTNICVYKISFVMACVKADWAFWGPGSPAYSATMTVYGPIYHYPGAIISSKYLGPCFFLFIFTT